MDQNEQNESTQGESHQKVDYAKAFPWLKLLFNFAIAVTAVIAICISMDANDTAEKAIKAAERQFIQINRPYLILDPVEKNGQFWKLKRDGLAVIMQVDFKTHNVGNVAAENVHFPDNLSVSGHDKTKSPFRSEFKKITDDITIAPGKFYYTALTLWIGKETIKDVEDVNEFIKLINSNKHRGITIKLLADYKNAIDTDQRYRTIVQYNIKKDEAILLKSEMINLSENEKK